jgi:hypothetical protein
MSRKSLDFFDSDMLQLFEIERFLFDHVIPRDRIPAMINRRACGGLITAAGWARRLGVHMSPALAPLARFPKGFEAHAIGWKGKFYA